MSLFERNRIWYYLFYVNGQRYRGSTMNRRTQPTVPYALCAGLFIERLRRKSFERFRRSSCWMHRGAK
jgi:hypothetical protein